VQSSVLRPCTAPFTENIKACINGLRIKSWPALFGGRAADNFELSRKMFTINPVYYISWIKFFFFFFILSVLAVVKRYAFPKKKNLKDL
jgi:hypothetical protein